MISEKRFATSYSSFWAETLPMATSYIRHRNQNLTQFDFELQESSGENRGVVNELAFRFFAESQRRGTSIDNLEPETVRRATDSTVDFIGRFREYSRVTVPAPSEIGVIEAKKLAVRLGDFVCFRNPTNVNVAPVFPGCGWVDECAGDIFLDRVLYEVKSGGEPFRSRDLRQVLIYAALNAQSRAFSIMGVGLVNPRRGVFFEETLDELSIALSGRPATDLLTNIISYISHGSWRDESV